MLHPEVRSGKPMKLDKTIAPFAPPIRTTSCCLALTAFLNMDCPWCSASTFTLKLTLSPYSPAAISNERHSGVHCILASDSVQGYYTNAIATVKAQNSTASAYIVTETNLIVGDDFSWSVEVVRNQIADRKFNFALAYITNKKESTINAFSKYQKLS